MRKLWEHHERSLKTHYCHYRIGDQFWLLAYSYSTEEGNVPAVGWGVYQGAWTWPQVRRMIKGEGLYAGPDPISGIEYYETRFQARKRYNQIRADPTSFAMEVLL